MGHIAFLGAGVMGETIIAGLRRADPDVDIVVVEKRDTRAAEVSERHGVRTASPRDAVAGASVIVLAVKPQDMASVLAEVADSVPDDALVISVAAGITTAFIERAIGRPVACVRVMPNTPALVNEGMAAVSAGSHCTAEHLDRTGEMLASVGHVVRVPESMQDAVTAVSGSGPAYVFLLVEAMVDAGTALGLPRDVAVELAVQTVIGAGAMLRATGEDAARLREQVTSPGGTTAAALAVLDERDLRGAFTAALTAARDRGAELSGGTA